MTASFDDAAASPVPPRAVGGPAAPSFPGTSGLRPAEDPSMPQHPPAHDETVRMRADGSDGRPSPHGNRRLTDDVADETRPVTRDWLSGAPVAPSDDEWATEALDVDTLDSLTDVDSDLTTTQAVLSPVTDEA